MPTSLAPFGDGYPRAGTPCRRLGESPLTRDYLDDSAILVGCSDEAFARTLGGIQVDTLSGITLVSISTGDANTGMPSSLAPANPEPVDALVPGTRYHATAQLPCSIDGEIAGQRCPAGVIRNWSEDGTTLVEVSKPDGMRRALFFQGNRAIGADSAEADGSAGWDFKVTRDGDTSVIRFGPETYVIADAFVVGG
ncbi:hypothetical protein C0039_07500 [Pseudohalioglobus lutimaris]|uniref:Uncharacterized protein n=1 Tax=Pseudohalioglobus lutimaris TaxID=1737061 RepID=A0A2N5X4W9_9GAMM|nr:hypothetical protein C0039_07500 [Pseudohalioglobus lutimaris]